MKFLSAMLALDPGWLGFLLASGIAIVCGLVGIIWALFFRKGRRHKHHRRRHQDEARAMSPTLAETGGLPPIRKPENFSDQSKS